MKKETKVVVFGNTPQEVANNFLGLMCGNTDPKLGFKIPHTAIQPADWPFNAPPYHSAEGWELEKKMALDKLKEILNIKKS